MNNKFGYIIYLLLILLKVGGNTIDKIIMIWTQFTENIKLDVYFKIIIFTEKWMLNVKYKKRYYQDIKYGGIIPEYWFWKYL